MMYMYEATILSSHFIELANILILQESLKQKFCHVCYKDCLKKKLHELWAKSTLQAPSKLSSFFIVVCGIPEKMFSLLRAVLQLSRHVTHTCLGKIVVFAPRSQSGMREVQGLISHTDNCWLFSVIPSPCGPHIQAFPQQCGGMLWHY